MAFLNLPQEMANMPVEEVAALSGGGKLPNLPPGKYRAVAIDSADKPTAKGGRYLEVKFSIVEGEHSGVELVDRFNIVNDNATAVRIAFGQLGKLAKACGLKNLPQDSVAFHNIPVYLVLKTEKGTPYKDRETGEERQGSDKSVIDGYESLPSSGVASASGKLPWQK